MAVNYVNVSSLVDKAMQQLQQGQMIKPDKLSLLDLMSAGEIMEPRTDSYLTLKQRRPHEQILPPFDPTMPLLPTEVVWIMSQLWTREATFHDGHPLPWTVLTCKYLRPTALEALTATAIHSTMHAVLKSLLVATIKTTEIIWQELAKGQVYEHEDVHLNTSSINFTDLLLAAQMSSTYDGMHRFENANQDDQVVTVDQVISELSATLHLLHLEPIDEQVKGLLNAHVTFRLNLVYSLALLTTPEQTCPADVQHFILIAQHALNDIRTMTVDVSSSADPKMLSIFSIANEPPLPSPQPPRDIQPLSFDKACDHFDAIMNDVTRMTNLWSCWIESRDWPTLQEYFNMTSQTKQMSPYCRSLHQSIALSSQNVVFTTSTFQDITSSFISCYIPLSVDCHSNKQKYDSIWSKLVQTKQFETSWNSPARKVLGWIEKVGIQLMALLIWNKCQNKARLRRLTIKSVGQLSQLIDEITSVSLKANQVLNPHESFHFDSFEPALSIVVLQLLIETLLNGFELDLYEPQEYSQIWWCSTLLIDRIEHCFKYLIERQKFVLTLSIEETESKSSFDWIQHQLDIVKVVRHLCKASMLMTTFEINNRVKHVSPFLESISLDNTARLRFEQRFGWIEASNCQASNIRLQNIATYEQWIEQRNKLQQLSFNQARTEARQSFQQALDALDVIVSTRHPKDQSLINRMDWTNLTRLNVITKFKEQWFENLLQTCQLNLNWLDSIDDQVQLHDSTLMEWKTAWFPVWRQVNE
ncbi:N-alpha-acetyltransferase, non-catalitic subunit [Microbotryomycetes sp. JL221]|nr:N-alpha-acetyltransferase, non-catalitic subunit [Microbotryomycetes sp. JL221]